MHLRAMSDASTRAQRYLACVSDPSRFRLVMALLGGERCVTDLAFAIGLSQSCTTRHVQALRREGIVESDRVGKRVMIRLALDGGELNPALRWALDSGAIGGESAAPSRSKKAARARSARSVPGSAGRSRRADHPGGRRRAPSPAETASTLPPAHELGWHGDEPGAVEPEPMAESARDPELQAEESEPRPAPAPRPSDLDDFLL
jgi:ArsR family transcriptional regulator